MNFIPLKVSFPHEGKIKVIELTALTSIGATSDPIHFETKAEMRAYVSQRFQDLRAHAACTHTELLAKTSNELIRAHINRMYDLSVEPIDEALNEFLEQYPCEDGS